MIESLCELKDEEAVLIESVDLLLRENVGNLDTELNRIEDLIIQLDEAICVTRANYLENRPANHLPRLMLKQDDINAATFRIEQTVNAPRIANFLAMLEPLNIDLIVNHDAYNRWASRRIYLNNILVEMDNQFRQIEQPYSAIHTDQSPTYRAIIELIVMLEGIDDKFINNVINYNALESFLNDMIANISENSQRTLAFFNLLQTLRNPSVRIKYNELTHFAALLDRFHGYCYQLMNSHENSTFSLIYDTNRLRSHPFQIQNSEIQKIKIKFKKFK